MTAPVHALGHATRAQRIERIMVRLLAGRLAPHDSLPYGFPIYEIDHAFECASGIVDYVDDKAKRFDEPAHRVSDGESR